MPGDRLELQVQIIDRGGAGQQVLLGGVDVSAAVASVKVYHQAGHLPVVDLHLVNVAVIERFTAEVRAVVEPLVDPSVRAVS